MKEVYISKRVLLDIFKNWKDVAQFYGATGKQIPFNEAISLIKKCPAAGCDHEYIESKRLDNAYKLGQKNILKQMLNSLYGLKESEGINDDTIQDR